MSLVQFEDAVPILQGLLMPAEPGPDIARSDVSRGKDALGAVVVGASIPGVVTRGNGLVGPIEGPVRVAQVQCYLGQATLREAQDGFVTHVARVPGGQVLANGQGLAEVLFGLLPRPAVHADDAEVVVDVSQEYGISCHAAVFAY